MPRWRHLALVTLFFLCTSALYTYPFLFHLSRAAMVGAGDYLDETARLAWNAHQLIGNPFHLFNTEFFYPHSNSLAYSQSLFFPALLATPLWALTGQPLLVTNVLIFLALVLSGVFMYSLALALTGRVLPSLLAGVVFSYFPNRMDHLGQFTVQMGFLLPLIFWGFYRFLLEGKWRHFSVTVGGIWTQMLSAIYYGYSLGFLLVAFLASFLLLRPRRLSWSLCAKGVLGFLLLALALTPFLTPYLEVHRDLGLERDLREAELYGMDLLSFLDPGVFNKLYGGRLVFLNRSEGGLFPGFVVLGLVAFAVLIQGTRRPTEDRPRWVVYAGRALLVAAALTLVVIVAVPLLGGIHLRLDPVHLRIAHETRPVVLLPLLGLAWIGLEGLRRRQGPLIPREWMISLVFLAVFMYLLTLTPTLTIAGEPWGTGLYTWVYRFVPGASAFRAPGRWALLFVLPLALLAAFGARAVGDRLGGRLAILVPALLLLAVMVEYRDFPVRYDYLPDLAPVYHWLAQQPGDFAILELPVNEGPVNAWAMLGATLHKKRLVNGAFGFVPPTLHEIAARARDPAALMEKLQSIFPLHHLVVHKRAMIDEELRLWEGARSAPFPGLRFVRSFDGDDVYIVLGTPQTGVDLRRYFSSDLARATPVAHYEVDLNGADVNVRRWVEISFNGRLLRTLERDASEAIPLPAPYKAGDRNELRFLHRYEVDRPGASRERYRIGRTNVYSPADILVISAGKEFGNVSSIRINGLDLSPSFRGYNIVAVDPRTARPVAAGIFDTFKAREESRRMAQFIERLAPGTIVIASVKDEAAGRLTEEGVEALRAVGGTEDIRGQLFVSHLLVGVKGARPGEALEAVGPRQLRAVIGHERPLGIMLRSFTLRPTKFVQDNS